MIVYDLNLRVFLAENRAPARELAAFEFAQIAEEVGADEESWLEAGWHCELQCQLINKRLTTASSAHPRTIWVDALLFYRGRRCRSSPKRPPRASPLRLEKLAVHGVIVRDTTVRKIYENSKV